MNQKTTSTPPVTPTAATLTPATPTAATPTAATPNAATPTVTVRGDRPRAAAAGGQRLLLVAHGVAVVSSCDFARTTGLPLSAFIAYELIFHGLRTQSPRYDPLALAHDVNRGCLFDLCVDKAEIAVKLQAGHVCAGCITALGALAIDGQRVERLWSAVQTLAHPT